MEKFYDKRFCSILQETCPEKTDGEVNYCQYYCKLYITYRDYLLKSRRLWAEEEGNEKGIIGG